MKEARVHGFHRVRCHPGDVLEKAKQEGCARSGSLRKGLTALSVCEGMPGDEAA